MKEGIHKALTIIAKPIFLASILLWSFLVIHFSFRLVTGRELGESVAKKVERNGVETAVAALFIIISIAFVRMSWQGLRYWPKRYPKVRFDLKCTDPDDADNPFNPPVKS